MTRPYGGIPNNASHPKVDQVSHCHDWILLIPDPRNLCVDQSSERDG